MLPDGAAIIRLYLEYIASKIHHIIYTLKLVQAFQKLYEAVGLGWVYAITKYEPVIFLNISNAPCSFDVLSLFELKIKAHC